MAPGPLRKSGIEPLGEIPWGTHICYFFDTAAEVLEVATSFFAAGVAQRERCVWLIADPILRQDAVEAVHGMDVEILHVSDWYGGDSFDDASVAGKGDAFLEEARQRGYAGLRVAGCQTWQRAEDWEAFRRYEASHDKWLPGKPVVFLCFYPLGAVGAIDVLEVVRNHHIAVARRNGQWKVLHTPDTTLLYARNQQQAAIAALGQIAIREHDLTLILSEAIKLAARTLATGRGLVWQLVPEHDHLVQRARAEWDELPADATIPLRSGTAAEFVLHNDTPVIVPDVRSDPRFEPSWLLREYGVVTMLSATIRGREHAWGVLSVHSKTQRDFTQDDIEFLQSMANVVALAIERKQIEEAREQLSRRLLTVQEEERRHIAVELHDQLGQICTAAKIKLDSVQRALGDHGLAAQVADVIEIVDSAAGTIRDLALQLRPAMLDDLGLAAALRWYADRFARQTGIRIHLAIDELPGLDPALATVCFRVAQEALTNAARHASAHNVWLDVHSVNEHVELTVRDDGVGFSVADARARAVRGESLGLLGMAERLSYTSGTLEVESAPGAGTTLSATLPLSKANAS